MFGVVRLIPYSVPMSSQETTFISDGTSEMLCVCAEGAIFGGTSGHLIRRSGSSLVFQKIMNT